MFFSWRLKKREKTVWMMTFLIGFLLGIGLVCLLAQELFLPSGFLDRAFLSRMKCLEMNRNGLFLFSLQQRMAVAAFLVLLSVTGVVGMGTAFLLVWSGVSAGAVMTIFSLRYGWKGLALFLGSILPQAFLLIPGYLLLLDWCFGRQERRRLLVPLLVVIMGCFLESYVNPYVLKVVLKLF